MLKIALMTAALAAATGCEKILDFDETQGNGIAVSAIVVPDQPFIVRVSRSFTVNKTPQMAYNDVVSPTDMLDRFYSSKVIISDARVEAVVNGTDRYAMQYDAENMYYTCSYVPKEGDEVELNVSADGYGDARTVQKIEPSRKIEILDKKVIYSPSGYTGTEVEFGDPRDVYGVDSVMTLTMRMKDPGGEHNYYRLRVCGVAEREKMYDHGYYRDKYSISDVFTSSDMIFNDSQLSKPYSDWPAGFSNVFDDNLFDGQEYTFTVETRKRYGDNARVIVELQTISSDLYYFLKSDMLFRISTDDSYMSPISLHTNVENGWGIFGSLSYDRHIIHYADLKEHPE